MGEVQELNAAPSRLQLNVAVVSVFVKLKLAVVLLVITRGLEVMEVSGGVLSSVTFTDEEAELEDISQAVAVIVAGPSGSKAEFQSKL